MKSWAETIRRVIGCGGLLVLFLLVHLLVFLGLVLRVRKDQFLIGEFLVLQGYFLLLAAGPFHENPDGVLLDRIRALSGPLFSHVFELDRDLSILGELDAFSIALDRLPNADDLGFVVILLVIAMRHCQAKQKQRCQTNGD